jgi:NADH:ubiquinone oxidoreductase subunit 6 (subunit J)
MSMSFLFWVIAGLTSACAIATVVTHNIVRAATWLLFTLAGTSGLFFLIGADLVGAVQLLVYVGGTMVLVIFGVMLTAEGPFVSMRTSSAEWAVSAATGITFLAVLLLSFLARPMQLNPQGDHEANVHFAPKATLVDPKATGNAANSPYAMVVGQGFAGVGVGPAHVDPTYRPLPKEHRGPATVTVPIPLNEQPKIDDLDNDNLKKIGKDRPAPRDEDDIDDYEVIKKAPIRVAGPPTPPPSPPDPEAVTRMNYLLPFEIVSVHLLVVLIAAAYLARAKRVEDRS